jgi:transketolase
MERDRFVLSNGHGCALLYAMLHLTGYDLPLDELRRFRQLGSKTPGHPEAGVTPGVEVTTGPLGSGISNAVGLAMAQAQAAARLKVEAPNEAPYFDNYTYVFTGDGCLQEGVSCEAVSLAGHWKLGRLIVLYDDNGITIDGSTSLSFTEDVLARFESYGWHTSRVANADEDLEAISAAIDAAKAVGDKPSIIACKTTIGRGSKLQGTAKVHGAPLGAPEIASMKEKWGFPPAENFHVPSPVRQHFASVAAAHTTAAAASHARWAGLAPLMGRNLPASPAACAEWLPVYEAGAKLATRQYSEKTLNALAAKIPSLAGGSADLTGSNLTALQGAADFQATTPAGRYIRFGVREHGMAAICNGMYAYGTLLPFCGTFLNFVGYAAGSVRLSALSHFRVLYIFTHDSIGLGEDGPTHQPIEAIPHLRAMPNMLCLRPADGNEVNGAYIAAVTGNARPSSLCLSRQSAPMLPGTSWEGTLRGAYTLNPGSGDAPSVCLVATGTEVQLIVAAAAELQAAGVTVRTVSMPSWELFEEQEEAYRQSVFTPGVPVISVEAASTFGWSRYAHVSIGIDTFGASAPAAHIYKHAGITTENIVAAAKQLAEKYPSGTAPAK